MRGYNKSFNQVTWGLLPPAQIQMQAKLHTFRGLYLINYVYKVPKLLL